MSSKEVEVIIQSDFTQDELPLIKEALESVDVSLRLNAEQIIVTKENGKWIANYA